MIPYPPTVLDESEDVETSFLSTTEGHHKRALILGNLSHWDPLMNADLIID